MNKAIAVFMFLPLFSLGGCSNEQQIKTLANNNLQSTASGSEQKSADKLEVNTGEEFVIILDENEATGYQWALVNQPDKKVVKFVSARYEQSANSETGAGGKSIWTFKALTRGSVPIALKYTRPWEKKLPAIKQQTFNVSVKEAAASKINFSSFFNKSK